MKVHAWLRDGKEVWERMFDRGSDLDTLYVTV